jgi:hypothetical protein
LIFDTVRKVFFPFLGLILVVVDLLHLLGSD